MKKNQTKSDYALKIFSVIIAVCLWFYVVQVESPDIERTVKGVSVVFTQQDVLAEKNLILLNDNEHTVDVRIQGTRKYVMDTNSKNLTVLADLGNIESTGRHLVLTTVVLPYANVQVINKTPSTLSVEVDHLVTAEKPIEIIAEGSPKSSFAVGNLTTTLKSVKVSGPKTIVDGIQSVAAIVDVSGKSADIVSKVPLKALGTGGTEIDTHLLTYSANEAEVHVEILKTKTVALQPVFSDVLRQTAEELQLDDSSVRSIKVAGAQSVLEELTSVRTKPITPWTFKDNEAVVELDLPTGVRSVDGETFTLRFIKKQ